MISKCGSKLMLHLVELYILCVSQKWCLVIYPHGGLYGGPILFEATGDLILKLQKESP